MDTVRKFFDELKEVVDRKFAIAAAACSAVTLVVGISSIFLGTVCIKTLGNPEETAILYYNAVVENDYAEARRFLKDKPTFTIENPLDTEEGKVLKRALEDSFTYELIGEMHVDRLNAAQTVEFTYLNMDLLEQGASERIGDVLNRKIDELPKNQLYDKDGNYQQSLLDIVYLTALNESLKNKDKYMVTDTYDVTLHYGDSKWMVTSTDRVLTTNIETYAANTKMNVLNEYLADNQVIRKIYKIEGNNVPMPKAENFGVVLPAEVDKVVAVIEQAKESGLLDGQEVAFKKDVNFYGDIHYYYDETILVVAWKEWIEGHVCAFCEIKVADSTQFRRKIADDAYGSGKQYYCTLMAKQTNAVAAMNADFYAFRNLGITVYDKEVHRVDSSLDTLFVDKDGNFHFLERGNKKTKDELQAYVKQNDIQFSLAFGPILIKDGELIPCNGYPIGEALQVYSRAGIGQLGDLHYLYADVGHYTNATVVTVNDFARYMFSKGVIQGYNLDGGQTGELVINNKIVNWIDFGNERTVSDMIYFATALPEGE